MNKPRQWTIPAGVGSYYDGKEVHFAVGPLLDLLNELQVDVIEKSAYDKVVKENATLIELVNAMRETLKERQNFTLTLVEKAERE